MPPNHANFSLWYFGYHYWLNPLNLVCKSTALTCSGILCARSSNMSKWRTLPWPIILSQKKDWIGWWWLNHLGVGHFGLESQPPCWFPCSLVWCLGWMPTCGLFRWRGLPHDKEVMLQEVDIENNQSRSMYFEILMWELRALLWSSLSSHTASFLSVLLVTSKS